MQLPQIEAEEQPAQQLDANEQNWIEHLSFLSYASDSWPGVLCSLCSHSSK